MTVPNEKGLASTASMLMVERKKITKSCRQGRGARLVPLRGHVFWLGMAELGSLGVRAPYAKSHTRAERACSPPSQKSPDHRQDVSRHRICWFHGSIFVRRGAFRPKSICLEFSFRRHSACYFLCLLLEVSRLQREFFQTVWRKVL
jgi:hypothetical protein